MDERESGAPGAADEQLDAFATASEAFCAWAEGESGSEVEEARMARLLVTELFRCAIRLPLIDVPDDLASAPEIPSERYQAMFRRFASLPFGCYSECYDPLIVPGEEPVVAHLSDDLADIWRDVKAGLMQYRAGDRVGAARHWRFHFEIHWGHHASAALYALQSWFSANADLLNSSDQGATPAGGPSR